MRRVLRGLWMLSLASGVAGCSLATQEQLPPIGGSYAYTSLRNATIDLGGAMGGSATTSLSFQLLTSEAIEPSQVTFDDILVPYTVTLTPLEKTPLSAEEYYTYKGIDWRAYATLMNNVAQDAASQADVDAFMNTYVEGYQNLNPKVLCEPCGYYQVDVAFDVLAQSEELPAQTIEHLLVQFPSGTKQIDVGMITIQPTIEALQPSVEELVDLRYASEFTTYFPNPMNWLLFDGIEVEARQPFMVKEIRFLDPNLSLVDLNIQNDDQINTVVVGEEIPLGAKGSLQATIKDEQSNQKVTYNRSITLVVEVEGLRESQTYTLHTQVRSWPSYGQLFLEEGYGVDFLSYYYDYLAVQAGY